MTKHLTVQFLVLSFALSVMGCRSDSRSVEPAGSGASPPAAEPAKTSGPLSLQVDREMLRDLRITTTKTEVRPAGEAVSVLGELRVDERRYAEVGAPITARAVRLLASLGDTVVEGQALVELQSGELAKARADFAVAASRVELASRVLIRRRDLAEERITPEREVQEAESQLSVAEAELRSARAALQALGVSADEPSDEPSHFTLRTPIAGTVIERALAVGQMVDPAKPLFEIADLSRLWLVVHAFERDAVRVRVGAAARVTLPAMPGRTFSGTVTLVGSRVDPDSRTVPVRLELPNPGQILRPGMSATAAIVLSETAGRVLTVPVAALQRVQDQWVVFIPQSEGAFEIRPVGRGRDLGGEVEILTGLRPDDTVVVDGAFLLKAEADKARGAGEHEAH
ncbi:MAG: efflux RND transporter periplasmic adaptor subunit [Vicinamibacterales bacterium]